MSTHHVYPGFIRLVDNSHVPVVLILDVDQRVMVRADVADTAEDVPALARELLSSGNLPNTVVYLDSPLFPDLVEGLDNVLSGTRHRPHRWRPLTATNSSGYSTKVDASSRPSRPANPALPTMYLRLCTRSCTQHASN